MTDESTTVSMTPYQRFIALSRYSRFLPEKTRRETWEETVRRYCDYFKHNNDMFPDDLIYDAIVNFHVMPSMRSMMTAGKALDRDLVSGYNCAYGAVDDPRIFDEAMYILMNGAGFGFSVERQNVSKLPEIAEQFFDTDTVLRVKDSRMGWCSSFRELINLLYGGRVPQWDLTAVRAAGAPLKTFGGRASGPKPLDDLFHFTVKLFKKAAGRKLSSIECHDLMCKVADIVVVGGVRRSSLISLSNLSDDRMKTAKTGQWWLDNSHRALSNNSAAYTEKPEIGIFLREWLSLYESKSGERGIFNRVAAKKKVRSLGGRRKDNYEFGGNPCVTSDTVIPTVDGPRTVSQLVGVPFRFFHQGVVYHSEGFWLTGTKPVYQLRSSHGYQLKATSNHRIAVEDDRQWVELGDLVPGDDVILANTRPTDIIIDKEMQDKGWLLGEIVGDGCYNPSKYKALVRFWGETAEQQSNDAFELVEAMATNYRQPVKPKHPTNNRGIYQVQSKKLDQLCSQFINEDKSIKPELLVADISLISGFISGLFDSDGTVGGDTKRGGIFLQLAQSNVALLTAVQQMLTNFGIVSRIHEITKGDMSLLPDGHGSHKLYDIKRHYRLDIGRDNIDLFVKYIGFRDAKKRAKLHELIDSRIRSAYATKFTTSVVDVTYCGIEPVYDCTVADLHAFPANGILVHNCNEIILRPQQFCNLSEVVVRENDTLEMLQEKVVIATIIGTFQATLTDFRYLRSIWKKNVEEERLLGVSLTGIMDHNILSTRTEESKTWFNILRETAVRTNAEWADKLGINRAAAITTIKPSGTVSSLVDSSSGIHPRMSRYYIRTVRNDKNDPVSTFLIEQGVPHETDVTKDTNWVFSFPMKSPDCSKLASEMTAIEQLEHYLFVLDNYVEHNISITVYIREHEWLDVGAWVHKHFDRLNGVSFLPYNDTIYQQAPYQPITEQQYNNMIVNFPVVDFTKFVINEYSDNTTGTQTLACTSGNCEI